MLIAARPMSDDQGMVDREVPLWPGVWRGATARWMARDGPGHAGHAPQAQIDPHGAADWIAPLQTFDRRGILMLPKVRPAADVIGSPLERLVEHPATAR